MHFDNPSPTNRSPQQKKIPATQKKTAPIVRENRPTGSTAWLFKKRYGLAQLAFCFLIIQLRVFLNNLQSCLSRQAKFVRPCQEIYPLPVLPF